MAGRGAGRKGRYIVRHRILAILTAAACVAAVSAATATPAQAAGNSYLPIGDSYAIGYPLLLGAQPDLAVIDPSGATTRTLNQLLAATPIPGGVKTVTLTVGGNDAGFSKLAGCLADDCPTAADIAKGIASVPSGLKALLTTIRQKAPEATIHVTGYPQLFQPKLTVKGLKVSLSCEPLPGFDPKDMLVLDTAAVTLNATIAATVKAMDAKLPGPRLTYVDVAGRFAGHGVCRSSSWITGLDDPAPLHLTAAGHAAYAAAITAKGF